MHDVNLVEELIDQENGDCDRVKVEANFVPPHTDDQENGDWDRVKIEANFVPPDTEAICRVTVGHMPEDFSA